MKDRKVHISSKVCTRIYTHVNRIKKEIKKIYNKNGKSKITTNFAKSILIKTK